MEKEKRKPSQKAKKKIQSLEYAPLKPFRKKHSWGKF